MNKATEIILNVVFIIGLIVLWAWGMETVGWKLF